MKYLFFFFLCLSLCAQAQDTLEHRVYFNCASAQLSAQQERNLLAISGEIISIEGYASIEGQAEANSALSIARQAIVSDILSYEGVGMGATAQFGTSLKLNRVVVVKYISNSTTTINDQPAVTNIETAGKTTSDLEGFTCGQRIDPSIYFADTTTTEEVVVSLPAPIELEVIAPTLPNIDSVRMSLSVITADTFYLPTAQAVRFYMKQGLSRSEAVKRIEARKPLWKPLKKGDVKRPKKRKRLPPRTGGLNDSFWSHLFPFRGC